MKPVLAIVGRPNVGKSTLFNRITGKRIAIVEDLPGLTRDRLYSEATWSGKSFLAVDTGGFQPVPGEDITEEVKRQAIAAIEEADVVLMLMDAQIGIMPSDVELSSILRKYNKQVFYAVNKIDGPKKEKSLYEYYSLGTEIWPVSAKTGYGFDELMNAIIVAIPESAAGEDIQYSRIAIVGRPNVGKSTLVNSLLGKKRMIVSPQPGTTRDAIDSICRYYKKEYLIIDTAGIRKRGKMATSFEKYSFIRTLKNIEGCDVALLLLDAGDGVVEMDQKIAGLIYEAGKGCMILMNKWDLVEKNSLSVKKIENDIYQNLWFMQYAPVITVSALHKQRITKIFPLVDEIIEESSRRISTRRLHTFLKKCLSIQQPPLYKGRRIKCSYITQVGIKPPSFILSVNNTEGIRKGFIRFLEKQLREDFSLKGIPVRIYIRQKTNRKKKKTS
jgi:GTP-binding protein